MLRGKKYWISYVMVSYYAVYLLAVVWISYFYQVQSNMAKVVMGVLLMPGSWLGFVVVSLLEEVGLIEVEWFPSTTQIVLGFTVVVVGTILVDINTRSLFRYLRRR